MKRLGLFLLPCLLACDLKEDEIGESGNVSAGEGGDSEDGSGSGSESGSGSDDVLGCTLIGCDDGLFVTIAYAGGIPDGNYQFLLADNDEPVAGCDFSMSGGNVEAPDCLIVGPPNGSEFQIHFPIVENPSFSLLRDGQLLEASDIQVAYEDVYPNGPACGVGCRQGYWTLDLGIQGDTCESLETDFNAEVEAVRGCTDAAECGQVIAGTSCGCTRNWVARNDADLTQFWAIFDEAVGLDCDWPGFGSTCDCPQADGYACVDNLCTWNYL